MERLSAKQARSISESTTKPIEDVYDLIRNASDEGCVSVVKTFISVSKECLMRIISELESSGFCFKVLNARSQTPVDIYAEGIKSFTNILMLICW